MKIPPRIEPAYLTWERPNDRRGYDVKILHNRDGYLFLHEWQNNRCAMCGTDRNNLVLDHCHESGLARGFLCRSCNTQEGFSPSIDWQIYREFPPCVLLGTRFYYNDYGQSPYPVPSEINKEIVSSNTDEWTDEFCHMIISKYADYSLVLDWLSRGELRNVVNKSMKHIRTKSESNIS